ncbi:MAG: alpha-L-fucosidase [Christensenellales bacterium]
MEKPIPTKRQLEYLDWEFGLFFHFGIRTFYEGHRDWDGKAMDLSAFNPTELDCEQWLKTAADAGAKYAILVTKHHDGFANWPSAYTEYSVKNTPWKDGKGDVVREFVDACRKYGLKVGLYCSAAQAGSRKVMGKEYDDFFINQLTELLTRYGKIDYLWFDGCGSENHEFDKVRIIKTIRNLQPEILIFSMWDPDTRWVGNESGLANLPNHNVTSKLNFSVLPEKKNGKYFIPVECDCRIRERNWFYSDHDEHTVKDTDELMGLYYFSVGRGGNLLLNIAPDGRGLLPEKDRRSVLAFGDRVRKLYAARVEAEVKCEENTYTMELYGANLVNRVIIEEDLTEGEHIEEFTVYIYPHPHGERVFAYRGTTVGHKHICLFPTVRTGKIDVVIEKENGRHRLRDLNAYYEK